MGSGQKAVKETRLPETGKQLCCLPSAYCLLLSAFCFLLVTRLEPVTYPGLGKNVFWVGRIRLELFAQLADEYSEVFSLFGVIAAPDFGEQGAMCQDLARVANKEGE